MAGVGGGAVSARSGTEGRAADPGAESAFARMPAAAGGDSGDAGVAAAADGSVAAEDTGIRVQGSGIRRQPPGCAEITRREPSAGSENGTRGKAMNWESFYLVCFLVGLLLSAVSLLGGMGHFGGHVHLPHFLDAGHISHIPHVGHVPHGAGAGMDGGANVPWWNAFSIMIFLCWFGAAGYLLTRYGGCL